jgi:hypothetical protein
MAQQFPGYALVLVDGAYGDPSAFVIDRSKATIAVAMIGLPPSARARKFSVNS